MTEQTGCIGKSGPKPRKIRMGPENEVYFMECFPREGTISLRPKGARDGEAVVRVSAGQVYRWAMKARADATKRRKTVRRGTLDFQRRRDA